MDRARVLALMDLNMQDMYRDDARSTPGGFVSERDGLVVCGSPRGTEFTNMAMVSGAVGVPALERALDDTFTGAGMPCSVWTRTHADQELEAAMRRAGFDELLRLPGMMLEADVVPPPDPPDLALRIVSDDAGRADYARLMASAWAVYGVDEATTVEHFALLASVVGPSKTAFIAYHADEPVAGAILYVSHDVGGVSWVGTVPSACGRGYGAAVTWAVAREGLRRGVRFMNLQASPLGAPVYRRMGFHTPTHYGVFVRRG